MTTVVSGVPFWETAPEAYSSLTLGKHTIRGITNVSIKRGRKRDKKSAPGKNGVKLGNKGFEAASVKIEWQVHQDEGTSPSARWDEAAAILADLEDAKRAEEALAISHPFCAIRGITAVVVDDIEGPVPVEKSGLFTFSLDCTEYFTPAAAKKGGKGTGGVAGVPFEATYVLVDKETGGATATRADGSSTDATSTGTNTPKHGFVVEPTPGFFREASTGKHVKLLDVDAADKRTPRERAEAKAQADIEAGKQADPNYGNTFGNPGSNEGADVAFIEDAEGNTTESKAFTKAKTEAKDLAP